MKRFLKLIPWFFLALFAVEIVAVMLPKKDGLFHTREFGRLPVLLNGRVQPMDSVARNSLLQIRSTGDLPLEIVPGWKFWHHPEKLRSTEWLLELMFRPETADTRYAFLIHHPELISELNLGERGIEKSGLRYYTYNDLRPVLPLISEHGMQASAIEDANRTTYQKQVLKLANAISVYQRLRNSIQPENIDDLPQALAEYKAAMPAGIAAFRAQQAGGEPDREALQRFALSAQVFDLVANYALPLTIPPPHPETDREAWANLGESVLGVMHGGDVHPAVQFYARMAKSYSEDNAAEFNSAVAGYREWLMKDFSRELRKSRAEYYYNQVKAFLHSLIIYVFGFLMAGGALLTFGAWPAFSEAFRRSSFYLITLAFVVHTFGIVFRMALEGRPPVTNLYSSAVFIGWGTCLLGLVLERFYKVGLGCAVAGLSGFVTLIIAQNLAIGGDTMEMMRAVLDHNFWLATHVITITIGYSTMFVAGLLAIAYIVLGVFTRMLSPDFSKSSRAAASGLGDLNMGRALSRMVYAVVCFAMLFSFVGTVLGGIWADQSWGRFWGWDPKENGALLIVLWTAIILHARWGKLVGDRGIMNLAIFGNIITAFSWFGVNMLGIGLHSYGFMDAAFKWLVFFTATQISLIGLGLLPFRMWKSFQALEPGEATPPRAAKADSAAHATT